MMMNTDEIVLKEPVYLTTAGDGYWSDNHADVAITKLELAYVNDEQDFGELRVYFDRTSWDVERDGLIYTDRLFMAELVAYLDTNDLEGGDVGYSEQGMQGLDYVSCDVGKDFIQSWQENLKNSG